jgi:hypothetical protein
VSVEEALAKALAQYGAAQQPQAQQRPWDGELIPFNPGDEMPWTGIDVVVFLDGVSASATLHYDLLGQHQEVDFGKLGRGGVGARTSTAQVLAWVKERGWPLTNDPFLAVSRVGVEHYAVLQFRAPRDVEEVLAALKK